MCFLAATDPGRVFEVPFNPVGLGVFLWGAAAGAGFFFLKSKLTDIRKALNQSFKCTPPKLTAEQYNLRLGLIQAVSVVQYAAMWVPVPFVMVSGFKVPDNPDALALMFMGSTMATVIVMVALLLLIQSRVGRAKVEPIDDDDAEAPLPSVG
jgi:hypothetical protein